MDENNDVIQKLHISASGLCAKRESIFDCSNDVCSFTDFLLKYNLKNEATSNIKIQEVLKKLNLTSKVRIYMRDDNFTTDIGIVNLHPSKGTHWICYIDEYYFDSYGCAPPENIKVYIKSKHNT